MESILGKTDGDPRPRQQREFRKPKSKDDPWWKLALECFVGAAVITYTAVAAWQLKTMNKTYGEIQKQTAAAQCAVKTAQESLKVGREHFQKDQRPYLWPTMPMGTSIEVNKPIKAGLGFVNYGKSPAVDYRCAARVFFGKNAAKDANQWFEEHRQYGISREKGYKSLGVVPPGIPASGDKPSSYATAVSREALDASSARYITDNDFAIFIVAHVDYFDISGGSYWTERCVTSLKSRAWANCETHNDVH